MKHRIREVWELNAANLITLFNMIFGCLSILSSLHSHFNWAVACIGFAAIADRYDGMVARHFQTDSPLGVQLDSMGDVISFGVAPGLLAYLALFCVLPNPLRTVGAAVTVCFICAGAFRLARYNVQGLTEDHFFTGVPITIAGSLLALLMLLRNSLSPYFYMVIMVILAGLEVSRVHIRKH